MIKLWSVVLWSRPYCLMGCSRRLGYIDVNMYLSAHLVGGVVLLSAPLSVRLPEDQSPLREGVLSALLRYGTIQICRDEDLIVIAVDQDPWVTREHVDCDLREAVHALGFNLVRIPRQHAIGMMKMAHVVRFFQRAPHLMMLARSQVDGAWTGGPHEALLPWSMLQDELSIKTIQDLVTWISESKEGRYDALLSTLAQGVTILTAWDQARP